MFQSNTAGLFFGNLEATGTQKNEKGIDPDNYNQFLSFKKTWPALTSLDSGVLSDSFSALPLASCVTL